LHDHPHIKEAVKSGRHILIEDARNVTLTPAEREILQLRNLRSNLYLPIRLEDHSIGVLILSSVKVKHRFSEEEISLLQGFAQQAAQVYENVRIYEHANQHARELEQEIAERKQAELEKEKLQAQLNQAQKMESVGRLAGGVAHDFNNMLGVILGHAEMSLEEIDPEAPLYATLQAVQHAAERSAALTRQLLAFARKQTVAPKVIDINETVAGMLNMLRRLIGEDIDLLWQPGEKLSPVKVDPSQIDQLLANLCVNARDAIDGVGKITIETQPATFDQRYCSAHHGYLPGEYILLAVSDDGCGMDQDTLNHIFEPFFTTKEQGKGTGLGLASVFGMVRQNNGFINVYSESGRGTTFKIYLPIFAVTSARVATKAPDMPAERGNETILLVEDEPAILQMTTMMLERLGYTVVAAATPGEAIRLAHEYRGRVDLLMTDVVMPEMNGRDLAKNLLLINPKLNRLFMSGYTANVIAHHGVLDEGVHFIQKPFSVKELSGKVREVLNGN
jgi:signal transduction histidine kinase